MLKKLKIAAIAIVAVLILTLVLQNTAPFEMKLLFTTVTLPAALLLFITATLGFVLGVGVSLFVLKGPKKQPLDPSGPARQAREGESQAAPR